MSTLLTLRELFTDQTDYETLTSSTDPSSTLANTYINNSIRKIVRRDRPRELQLATPVDIATVQNQNTVTIPATVFVPTKVYFKRDSGKYKEIMVLEYGQMVQMESPDNFFDTTNTGTPDFCAVRGASLVFNKYFKTSDSAGVKLLGSSPPTTLSADGDTTELPSGYDLLITYESMVLFYQKDDDTENLIKFQGLAKGERSELKLSLDPNDQGVITLDPYTFTGRVTNIGNPNVFFSS